MSNGIQACKLGVGTLPIWCSAKRHVLRIFLLQLQDTSLFLPLIHHQKADYTSPIPFEHCGEPKMDIKPCTICAEHIKLLDRHEFWDLLPVPYPCGSCHWGLYLSSLRWHECQNSAATALPSSTHDGYWIATNVCQSTTFSTWGLWPTFRKKANSSPLKTSHSWVTTPFYASPPLTKMLAGCHELCVMNSCRLSMPVSPHVPVCLCDGSPTLPLPPLCSHPLMTHDWSTVQHIKSVYVYIQYQSSSSNSSSLS